MTIIRTIHGDRIAIDLTEEQVYDAYIEQQFKLDCDDVWAVLEEYSDELSPYFGNFSYGDDKLQPFVEKAANVMRYNLYKWEDHTLEYARYGVEEVLRSMQEEAKP